MPRVSKISETPPPAVTNALNRLGHRIRTTRLERRLSKEELAHRIGISRFVLSDIENGKPTTAIAAYLGALWALGLLSELRTVIEPARDRLGKEPRAIPLRQKTTSRTPLQIHLR